MSYRETGQPFKRILSSTSYSSGGHVAFRGQADSQNNTKYAKLRTAAPDFDYGKNSKSYNHCSDYEPLLNHELSTSPSDVLGDRSPQQIISPHNFTSGHLTPLDFRKDCPRGIMSVTDIELTLGDEDPQHFHPHGSPMDGCMSTLSASPKSSSQFSTLVRCARVSCDENSCLWHRCVLKLPHYVKWEDKTITVELQKKDAELYGFNHKSKQHAGTDEIYTLVSHVQENSKAARSGLALGDLVLSVNNIPMQSKEKISEVDIRNQNKLRLQIQHPLEISSKAASYVEQLWESMKNKQMSNSSTRLPQPPTPSTSPIVAGLAQPGENIPLFSIPKPETKNNMRYHQLPQVRVFVVGNATNEFIHSLIGDFINLNSDTRARCFEISMKKCADGSVSVGNSESFSYLFDNSSESCINVELVSVSDESFFHHCCSWMFTPNSVFILTFDTKRLSLSSETEMSRLCSLASTVRTGTSGGCSYLQLCGIITSDDGVSPEEVQTLFYTSLGKSLPEPRMIPTAKGELREEIKQYRLDIFSMLMDICDRQQVIYPTAIVLDMLVSQRRLTTTVGELAKTVEDWNPEPQQVAPEALYRVIEDLRNTGNLLVTGLINAACTSENVKQFVLPCVLFDHLSHLVEFSERDRVSMRQQDTWVDLYSCGIVTRTEFFDVLSVCTPHPEKLLRCMEDLSLVFPVRFHSLDSGFGDISNILFPYFLQDVPFTNGQGENYELYMTVEFSDDVPVSTFFAFLSELSQCDHCHSFKMRAQFVGQLVLREEDICLYFVKTSREVRIFKNRTNRPTESVGKQTVPQQIQLVLSQQIPSSVRLKVRLHSDEKTTNMANGFRAPVPGMGSDEEQQGDVGGQSPEIIREDDMLHSQTNTPEGAMAFPHVPICEQIPNAVGHEPTEEERRQNRVLDTGIRDLRYIHRPLHDLYCYLSEHNALNLLAAECGLSLDKFSIYGSVIQNRPTKLPAEAFLELYFQENFVTLRNFIQILMRMEEQQHNRLGDMIKSLLEAALNGNS